MHVCSEAFLRNVRHKWNVFCISLGQWSERLFRVFLGLGYYRYVSGDFRLAIGDRLSCTFDTGGY